MKSFKATLNNFNSPLWGFHIIIPDDIAQNFIEGDNRRVICHLSNHEPFQCALMPKGDGHWFININKSIRTKFDLKEGIQIDVSLEKDESKYGLPMTPELRELLDQDEEGNRLFHELTPGKQRNLIYWSGQVKNSDKRIIRALTVVEHLKGMEGKIDFKKLNEELKINNKRMA